MDSPWAPGPDYGKSHTIDSYHQRIGVGFDRPRDSRGRFLVQLQHGRGRELRTIAQVDHDPESPNGHDVYAEGLHVDVYGQDGQADTTLYPDHPPLSRNLGRVIRRCVRYLDENNVYLRLVSRGDISPDDPPRFQF